MERTKIINTANGKTAGADVIQKTDRRLIVILDNSTLRVEMTKNSPHDKNYVGSLHGMEFTSTGD